MEYQDVQSMIYKRSYTYQLDLLVLMYDQSLGVYGYALYVGYNSYVDSVQGKTTVADAAHPELETILVMGDHQLFIPDDLFATWAIKDDQPYAGNIIRQGVDRFLRGCRCYSYKNL